MLNGQSGITNKSHQELLEMTEGIRHLEMPMVKYLTKVYEGTRSSGMIPVLTGNLRDQVHIHPVGHNDVVMEFYMPYADYRYEENSSGVVHWNEVYVDQHESALSKFLEEEIAKEMGF